MRAHFPKRTNVIFGLKYFCTISFFFVVAISAVNVKSFLQSVDDVLWHSRPTEYSEFSGFFRLIASRVFIVSPIFRLFPRTAYGTKLALGNEELVILMVADRGIERISWWGACGHIPI